MKQITYDLSNITEEVFSVIKDKAAIAKDANENAIVPVPPTDNTFYDNFIKTIYGKPNIDDKTLSYLQEPCVYIPVQYGNKRMEEPIFFDENPLDMMEFKLGKTTWFDPSTVPDNLNDFKKVLGECIEYDLQLLNKQEVVFDYLYSEFSEEYEDMTKQEAFEKFLEKDPSEIGLAHTYDEETCEHIIQANANLLDNTISVELDNVVVDFQEYKNSEEFIEKALVPLNFDELTNSNPNVRATLEIKNARRNVDDSLSQDLNKRKKLS